MSDIRTLLDEATPRPQSPHDPVAAVHARVHRRTARRRAAVAAGASVAVAATGTAVVSTRSAPRASVTPAASASPAPSNAAVLDTRWRTGGNTPYSPDDPRYAAEFARVYELFMANLDQIVAVTVQGADDSPGWLVAVALGADADPEAWRPRIAAAAGSMPWRFKQCAATARHYDTIAAEVAAAEWPSGARADVGPYANAVLYSARCSLFVGLTGTRLDPRDAAFAKSRWGDDVYVHVKPAPASTKPSPNADGTLG